MKINRKPSTNSDGVVHCSRPEAMVAIQANTWIPLGNDTAMLAAEKKPSDRYGNTGREHVVHPQTEAEESGRDQRHDDQVVSDKRGAGHGRHDHRHHAGGRKEDDVDLRMPEEPEEVLPQQRIAAFAPE